MTKLRGAEAGREVCRGPKGNWEISGPRSCQGSCHSEKEAPSPIRYVMHGRKESRNLINFRQPHVPERVLIVHTEQFPKSVMRYPVNPNRRPLIHYKAPEVTTHKALI
ncbi:UNVERIFIED_CONTAM: hypothetical protein Sradi_7006400 [Sesamum radiatum]|uniref:Uncharacterized protein n=1 Tax=Sesamum radiatum TaxID=300843 RepID=A0AAW2JCR0_SESRA